MREPPTFPRQWEIASADLLDETFSSLIWKVARDDGSIAVVKDVKLFDDMQDELRGAHLLAWRRGNGLVRLLGQDGNRMLLEFAGERHLSENLDEQSDIVATDIAADIMQRLHASSEDAPPAALQPLAERFSSLFAKAGQDRLAEDSAPYVEAVTVAQRLLDAPCGALPLHGDLHHDNILFGPRGWLAIDPKGVLGDPGFDAANLFYNPLDRDDLCLAPERIAGMAETFSRTMKQDPRRLLDYAFAYGCLSAAWHREDGNIRDENRELAVAAAIRQVRRGF
ncbi:3'-kinase [Mesorhizobium sp. Root157]|uniref:aminoglycoside phosphotransferase family protein n=1 Tax=Mesorhizobium sp. Root157 TaxID=1736477 RepID=UPI000700490F|nr:aminoglycoside phosphotransferase family protein [Mesorhizobium sp. Root157]KQZ96570.1 3'-kinase [Mesorhizobium sp. Root157]